MDYTTGEPVRFFFGEVEIEEHGRPLRAMRARVAYRMIRSTPQFLHAETEDGIVYPAERLTHSSLLRALISHLY